MTEVKKTLTILRSRWPEVTLIIGLHLFLHLLRPLIIPLLNSFGRKQVLSPNSLVLLHAAISLLLWAFLILVHCGFLRTAYLEGDNRQSALVLIRTGKHFFRRIFLWNLMYAIPFVVLMLLYVNLIVRYIRPDKPIVTINPLCSVAIKLALIKLSLLIPALIIVLDCEVTTSFKLLRRCKLSNAKELIALFLVQIALGLLWTFASQLSGVTTIFYHILMGIYYIVSTFIALMIGVTAVRFVASLDLVCGEKAGL